ncbi:uncharacterized protein J4E79_002252 [Alternaria viburni]|uniref:uncharacterized protein n=2 Tax=Alternaria sect. Infectoriae TaxID=2499258 RepID=UPI0020C34977|nr:uncharacterized protein J4E79_002252 [Alternaria viburni]KAI4667563.1 hypothetical protein J4E79_002252 [Alternaria viburni]
MASGTALTPAIIATWPIPNYVDPVSQRGSVEAAIYATTIPMVLFVAGRIYVRANQKSGVGADDWIMVGAAYNVASVTMYNASMTLTKLSVCMTYLKLFPSRTNKLFCWTMIGYQLLWGVISSALYILQCV